METTKNRVKLYQALPPGLYPEAPLCLLLCERLPLAFSEYPLAFLVALELPPEVQARYVRYAQGRASS